MRNRHRSKSEWRKIVKDYRTNHRDKSRSQYCREQGLSATTFSKWYKQFENLEDAKFVQVPEAPPRRFYLKFLGLKLLKLEEA